MQKEKKKNSRGYVNMETKFIYNNNDNNNISYY